MADVVKRMRVHDIFMITSEELLLLITVRSGSAATDKAETVAER